MLSFCFCLENRVKIWPFLTKDIIVSLYWVVRLRKFNIKGENEWFPAIEQTSRRTFLWHLLVASSCQQVPLKTNMANSVIAQLLPSLDAQDVTKDIYLLCQHTWVICVSATWQLLILWTLSKRDVQKLVGWLHLWDCYCIKWRQRQTFHASKCRVHDSRQPMVVQVVVPNKPIWQSLQSTCLNS